MAGQVLHIESAEAVELAEQLAASLGKPVEEAVVQALRNEKQRVGFTPERERYLTILSDAPIRLISAVSLYESDVVVFRCKYKRQDVDNLLRLVQTLALRLYRFRRPMPLSA